MLPAVTSFARPTETPAVRIGARSRLHWPTTSGWLDADGSPTSAVPGFDSVRTSPEIARNALAGVGIGAGVAAADAIACVVIGGSDVLSGEVLRLVPARLRTYVQTKDRPALVAPTPGIPPRRQCAETWAGTAERLGLRMRALRLSSDVR